MPILGASRGYPVALQALATTGNGNVVCPPSSFNHHSIYIKGNDTPSAGAIQIEGASDPEYTGTWAPIGGGPVTVPDGEVVVTFEGQFRAIRARVSTTVTSGTADVTYIGAP